MMRARLRNGYGLLRFCKRDSKAAQNLPVRKVVPVERHSPERKAEFILSNATADADYRQARKEVQKLGTDPDSIRHRRPALLSEPDKELMGSTVSLTQLC